MVEKVVADHCTDRKEAGSPKEQQDAVRCQVQHEEEDNVVDKARSQVIGADQDEDVGAGKDADDEDVLQGLHVLECAGQEQKVQDLHELRGLEGQTADGPGDVRAQRGGAKEHDHRQDDDAGKTPVELREL